MYEVSNFFFTALENLLLIVAFMSFSDRRDFLFKHLNKVIIFIVVATIYSYSLSLILPVGLQTFPVVILTIVILNYIFNGSFFKSLLKHFLAVIGLSFVELFIVIFCVIILKFPMDALVLDKKLIFICSIFAKFIESLLVFILYKSNKSIDLLIDKDYHRSKFAPILTLISSALIILIGLNIYISGDPEKLQFFNIFSFIVYAILIFSVIIMFREFSNLEMLEFASKLEKENVKQLIAFNEMVAKERHEYKNHLNTIYGLCTLNKPDLNEKIKSYINNYANNNETRNITIGSGNDYVDAIINVKYNNAIQKGVDIIVDFATPLSVADIAEDVAVTIFSNIIENAFESISLIEKEKKFINVQTYVDKNTYYISISNNGPMITDADKKKIFNAGYSTKDNISKKRGFGLSIVHSAIEQSGGSIMINSTEDITEFLIALPVKAKSQSSIAKLA
ncbi:sensor histidine kinase [Ruminiclostridium herbifermentans]|uniref:sensor histidine kinase n=1 Tax=Ruminiclostridium herbifermentans TaxID=2488810 RepID=UPI001FD2AC81|nr:GHKL domain-containing protein [Ruminiclostridium herbifermentans]